MIPDDRNLYLPWVRITPRESGDGTVGRREFL